MFEDRNYTPPEVADIMRVNPDSIRVWIRIGHPVAGRLPATNTGMSSRPRFRIWGPDAEAFFRATMNLAKKPTARTSRIPKPRKQHI